MIFVAFCRRVGMILALNLDQSSGNFIFIFIGTICGGLVFRKMSEGDKSATLSKGHKCHNMTKVQAFQTSFQVLIFYKASMIPKVATFSDTGHWDTYGP